MPFSTYESWGRFPKLIHKGVISPGQISEVNSAIQSTTSPILPRGLGRSYGDSCLNADGYLVSTRWLNKFLAFDSSNGILRCEAGVTFEEILEVFVPKGWFLPVTPGTKFVTVAGAIANDIHGKNHHRVGSFGNYVTQFELLRSDGTRIMCSREAASEWFRATIGGLGLTGVILWAEFALKPIQGPYLSMESIKFENLNEFFNISKESDQEFEYTVAWLDCLASGKAMGRGIFMRANHGSKLDRNNAKRLHEDSSWKTIPVEMPHFLLSKITIKAFNTFYYHKQFKKKQKCEIHYDPFFYPLDAIKHWNRLYGRRGFLQWQSVVPKTRNNETIKAIINKIAESKLASFLAVLKEFGAVRPQGMLSFPMPGVTLALDFPNVGQNLFRLLDELDEIVVAEGGRIYPAKDARMKSQTFMASFSDFEQFTKYIDPKFSSSFYRRVTNNGEHAG